jgi:long-chain acyl-CoA synthetase
MLSHANFVSDILALRSIVEFTERDKCLSFLPLSHVLERMCTFAFISQGTSIAYAEGVETVAENLLEARPTIMVSVPRLFEKIYAGVMDNILLSAPWKRKLFLWAMGVGKKTGRLALEGKKVPSGLRLQRTLAGRLVFNRILERTGGRIRFFVSGGAPLAKDIAEFFFALGLTILEGYGLTETSPVISVNTFEKLRFGSVGPPIPGVDVKIAEDGEILVRGPIVMQGYYNLKEETLKVFTDGWFHTGDIGSLDDDGFLYVTDRKKDLIVTSGGKNVAPQILENMVRMNPYVSGVVVVGARRKFISAVVVPDFERLGEYARSRNISFRNFEELVTDPRILDFYMKEIDKACRGMAPFERIKKIVLLPKDFELEAGEVTPTLKIRRHIVEEKYRKEIDRLYSQ